MGKRSRNRKLASAADATTEDSERDAMDDDDANTNADQGPGGEEEEEEEEDVEEEEEEGKENDDEHQGDEEENVIREARRLWAKGKDGTAEDEGKHFKNREKVLIVSSRGITARYRHLMEDFASMLPHCKKESKLDEKNERFVLNEVAEMHNCTSALFFEVRKHQDLYLWFSKTPSGPSAKLHISNVHTMSEMKLTGNHLKGSRPVLCFAPEFDDMPHLQVLKELLTQIFVTPRKHRRSKPFIDHILYFGFFDNRIWFRNYQVADKEGLPTGSRANAKTLENLILVEVGPRCCMNPIRIFSSSFKGATLYENEDYISPSAVRREGRQRKLASLAEKAFKKKQRKSDRAKRAPKVGEFAGLWGPD